MTEFDQPEEKPNSTEPVYDRIAYVTRMLRDSLRELGLEPTVQAATQAMPDVRSRIRYITSLTEQAANTVLNSTEKVQDDLSALKRDNQNLAEKINALSEDGQGRVLLPAGLLDEIKAFHNGFREKIKPVDQAMIEIITAQSFQDMTGQVSGKLTVLIERVEQELLQVLSDNIPEGKGHWQEPEPEGDAALLNGPAVEPADDTTVQNQQQVDDLLAKLGF